MMSIKDLLNKIKWDPKEKPEDCILYYEDRKLNKLIEIKYTDILRIEDNFMILQRQEQETSIPLHRIKKVKKKDFVVWQRK